MIDIGQVEGWIEELPDVLEVQRRNPPDNGGFAFGREKACLAAWNVTYVLDALQHEIVIAISDTFPADMPKVYLRNPEDYGLLAHINYEGSICFFDTSVGAFYDIKRPREILHSAIQSAMKRVHDSLEDTSEDEIVDEFDGAWRWLKGTLPVHWISTPPKQPTKFAFHRHPEAKEALTYIGSFPEYSFAFPVKDVPAADAWYFPLSTPVLPPETSQITAAYVRDLFQRVQGDKDAFDRWMANNRFRYSPPRKIKPAKKKKRKNKPRNNRSQSQEYIFLFFLPQTFRRPGSFWR